MSLANAIAIDQEHPQEGAPDQFAYLVFPVLFLGENHMDSSIGSAVVVSRESPGRTVDCELNMDYAIRHPVVHSHAVLGIPNCH